MRPRNLWRDVSRLGLAVVACLALVTGASAGTEKVLYAFQVGTDGGYPTAGVIFDNQGNLYGTAQRGGSDPSCSCGVVYELSPNGGAWTETVLYSFTGGTDGAFPAGDLIFDSAGNLYGTTFGGGGSSCNGGGCGTVFELSSNGGTWTETVLHSFTGYSSDGSLPMAALVFDGAGNLYGTTWQGGGNCTQCGTVFELSPNGNGTWSENVLLSFCQNCYSGYSPESTLVFDQAGNLYGTTTAGGGLVFELSPTGSGWSESELYNFKGTNGRFPPAGVIFGKKGALYGVTSDGGGGKGKLKPDGTVFKLSPAGVNWKESMLHRFQGYGELSRKGTHPGAGLVMDGEGHIYGTTVNGGGSAACNFGCGTVFKLAQSGKNWQETVLYSFTGDNDGSGPRSVLTQDSSGNLYGTTEGGGNGCGSGCGGGTVYEITP
jgi:uncharacterized repeat protein (TIGR03803 family)